MSARARVSAPKQQTGNIVRDSALGFVPETLDPYLALCQQLWHGGPLSASYLEMARLRNARKVNCVFCKSVRYDVAVEDGLSEDKVDLIEDDFELSNLSEREKLVLAYTDQYLNDPAGLGEELKSRLTAAFSAEEIVHLSLSIILNNGFSRFAVAMGGMPEELPLMEIAVPE